MANPTTKKPAARAAKPVMATDHFSSTDRETCFKRFSTVVENIAPDALEHWPGDAEVIRVNAERALAAIEPHVDRLAPTMQHT